MKKKEVNYTQDNNSEQVERIKVTEIDIIVNMMSGKPYYEIKYKKVGEDYYHVGYSSYKLENVLDWKDECFDIVKERRPQINADRIQSMTDEELTMALLYVLRKLKKERKNMIMEENNND